MLKKPPYFKKWECPRSFSFKVSGDKTKQRDSPLWSNPEKVVKSLQSEMPQSDFSALDWLRVDKGL